MTTMHWTYASACLAGTALATVLAVSPCRADDLTLGGNPDVVWQKVTTEKATPELEGDTYSLDVGNGQTLTWEKGRKLNIAAFEYAMNNTYMTAHAEALKKAAAAVGAEITIFDGQANPAVQRTQMQNALASGRYNAVIIIPIASEPTCEQITSEMPAANLPVIVAAQQTCGRDAATGADLWSPGIVSWVGNDWPALDRGWIESVHESLAGPTKAIHILGPADNTRVAVNLKVVREADAEFQNLDVVAAAHTDYTAAGALTQVQNLLQAHPDVGAVLLQFGGQLPGVVQAIDQAGKKGKIKIYDIGGTQEDKPAIEAGELEMTVPFFPYTQAYCAVEMLAAMNAGHAVPRVVVNDCHTTDGSPDKQNPVVINKDNVAKFVPQG